MLSTHYVSIMMWIFYIDRQQYWKCDWTINIGATWNAHGKRTALTKQPTSERLDIWASRYWRGSWASFQVTRLIHSATIFSIQPGWWLEWRVLFVLGFFWGGWGWGWWLGGSARMHLIFGAVYQSQGRRGYLDVSNVALVCFNNVPPTCCSHH